MEKRTKISNQDIKYDVVHRKIKYPRLEFRTGSLLLVLPDSLGNEEDFLKRHQRWIYKKTNFIKNTLKSVRKGNLIEREDAKFRDIINRLVKDFSGELKGRLNKVFFKTMSSKWASMSYKGNLTINTLLKYLPDKIIKYVVFHEIVHLRERKHNDRFWRLVSKRYKNPKIMESSLFKYWFLVQNRTDTTFLPLTGTCGRSPEVLFSELNLDGKKPGSV